MESAGLRRPATAAADGIETGRLRRFPDLPPPPTHGGANASLVAAALARRREELLLELNETRIRQDMILLELVETENAMGLTAAIHNPVPSQDYWHFRTPLVPPLEEAPLCSPCSSTEVRVPPVYPHVEWSPSSLPQTQPASDSEKQQDCSSSGARTPPFDGYVELCQSPNKQALTEEASVPTAADSGARPTFREETPGHKYAACGECKADVEDGHGVHPLYGSGDQSSGQAKTTETTPVDQIGGPMLVGQESTAFDQQKVQESTAFDQQKGQESTAFDQQKGQESTAFDQQKGREISVETPEHSRLGSGSEQQQECRSGEGGNVFNGYAELCPSPSKRAPVEETVVAVVTKAEVEASGQQCAFGGEPKVNVEGSLGVQPFGEVRNCSGQSKAVESAMEDRSDKSTQLPGQHSLSGLENATYNEQKKVEFSEPSHERTSAGVKRKLNGATSPVKKRKWKPKPGKYSCTICHVNTPSPIHLEEHLGGKLHRSKLNELQSSGNAGAEPSTKATPVWKNITTTNAESSCEDGKENMAESSGLQQGGKSHSFLHGEGPDTAKAADGKENTVESSGLQQGGKPHSFLHSEGPEGPDAAKKADGMSTFDCKVCNVCCANEKVLAGHLAGKKHRRKTVLADHLGAGRRRGAAETYAGTPLQFASLLVHGEAPKLYGKA